MSINKALRASVIFIGLAASAQTAPQNEVRVEHVRFAAGASSRSIKGSIKGYASVKYMLNARAGQVMTVKIATSNPQNYFNVLPPKGQEALFVGSGAVDGKWSGTLKESGEYTVDVYLMRAAARRNETANYTITFSITDPASAEKGAREFQQH